MNPHEIAATPRNTGLRVGTAIAIGLAALLAVVAVVRPEMMMAPIHRAMAAIGWFG